MTRRGDEVVAEVSVLVVASVSVLVVAPVSVLVVAPVSVLVVASVSVLAVATFSVLGAQTEDQSIVATVSVPDANRRTVNRVDRRTVYCEGFCP